MLKTWSILTAFVFCLVAYRFLEPDSGLPVVIAARFTIALCFLVGLLVTYYDQWGGCIVCYEPPIQEVVRYKTIALRLGLLLLLLYPCLMSIFLPSWPTAVFNFEYLLILPLLLLAVPPYVRWAESFMPSPDDAYYRMGQVVLRQRAWNWREHKPLLLAWGVKLFFIPLMYSWLVLAVETLLDFEWVLNPAVVVAGLFVFGLSVDLLVASAGYFFASRLLNNEVKSTDATWLGWAVCLICYPPFLEFFLAIKAQRDDLAWTDWLLPNEPLYWVWAFLITASWLVYWLSTMSFGLRFSNLSWRGLVDSGPYRYTKHPAYISKNIYWWLHTVPFVGVADGMDLLRNVLGLSFVSGVYYLRARTEERHLLAFSEYVEYAEKIRRDGLLARISRLFRQRPECCE